MVIVQIGNRGRGKLLHDFLDDVELKEIPMHCGEEDRFALLDHGFPLLYSKRLLVHHKFRFGKSILHDTLADPCIHKPWSFLFL